MLPRLLTLSVLLLALSRTAHCYGDDDEGYGGGGDEGYGGGDEDGYGGGDEGGGEAPPAAGDAKELLTVDDFDAFLDDNDASVVGAFTSKDMPDPDAVKPEGWDDEEDGEWSPEVIQNPSLTAFNAITTETYGYRWAYTSAPDVLAKLKAKSDGSLFLYKSPRFLSKEHGDRPRERFPSATLTQSAVSNWLASKSQPLVGLFNSDTKERYVGRYGGAGGAKPAALVVFMNLDFEKNSKSVQYVLKRARKVAAARKGKISVAIASLDDQRYSLDDYGLAASKSSADILMGLPSGSKGVPSTLCEESAPSARLAPCRPWVAPTHPRAQPEPLEGLPWPQELA